MKVLYLMVYHEIVTTIGRCDGAILVLLDLTAAFDTIDHDKLFYGNALNLIRYFFLINT